MFSLAVRVLLLLAGAYVVLVYVFPYAERYLPGFCAVRGLTEGICREETFVRIRRVAVWAQANLALLGEDPRVRGAVVEAREALRAVEGAVRARAGEERVNEALAAAENAVERLALVVEEAGAVQRKLQGASENAGMLLTQLRDTFGRLREILGSTAERARDVESVFAETEAVLESLAEIFPSSASKTR